MLNTFNVIYTSSNETLEQHKRLGFVLHMANASLITHTDVAEIAFLNLARVFIYTLTYVYKSSKGYVLSNYTFSWDSLLLHCSALCYEPKSNVLAHLIYYLFTIYNQFSLL